jgi:pyruvate dehydrogenase E2 component (dihydrolipoamide acetyltransferase)
MTKKQLHMPRLGETMEEGRIVSWRKGEGENFARGDVLLDVETDKTVAEVPALTDGKLLRHLAHEGDMIAVDSPIADVDLPPGADLAAPGQKPAMSQPHIRRGVARPLAPVREGVVAASPRARRLAAHTGIDLRALQGSGRRGRIQGSDVLRAGANASRAAGSAVHFYFLHGFAGEANLWLPIARNLNRQGVDSTLGELPGHGQTLPGPTEPEAIAVQLAHALRALGRKVHLVGHSLGAVIAVMAAEKLPGLVSGLTLVSPLGLGRDIDQMFIDGMQTVNSLPDLESLLARTTRAPLVYGPSTLKTMLAQLQNPAARAYRQQLARHLAQGGEQQVSIRASLRALDLPISLITGRSDRIVSYDDMADLPHRIALYSFHCGHMPMLEFADDVAAILKTRVTPG